jgi:hypothetical protein
MPLLDTGLPMTQIVPIYRIGNEGLKAQALEGRSMLGVLVDKGYNVNAPEYIELAYVMGAALFMRDYLVYLLKWGQITPETRRQIEAVLAKAKHTPKVGDPVPDWVQSREPTTPKGGRKPR